MNDVVIAATPETILVNYQCMMRIALSFGANQGMVLNVLVDIGAQSNLIRTGLVPDRLRKEASRPLEFRTVSHERLPGGTREIEAICGSMESPALVCMCQTNRKMHFSMMLRFMSMQSWVIPGC